MQMQMQMQMQGMDSLGLVFGAILALATLSCLSACKEAAPPSIPGNRVVVPWVVKARTGHRLLVEDAVIVEREAQGLSHGARSIAIERNGCEFKIDSVSDLRAHLGSIEDGADARAYSELLRRFELPEVPGVVLYPSETRRFAAKYREGVLTEERDGARVFRLERPVLDADERGPYIVLVREAIGADGSYSVARGEILLENATSYLPRY